MRKDIPKICLYSLYTGVLVLLGTGYLFYVWENPSSFPWLYRKMIRVKGALIVKKKPK